MTHRFTYSPGAASAVCVGDWAVLVGLPPTHGVVGRLYEELLRGAGMDALTDLLASTYGEFTDVLVLHATDPVTAFLWGACGVESTGGVSLTGHGIGAEHQLPGLVGGWVGTTVVPSGHMLPAGQGVFPAGRIESTPVPVAAPIPADANAGAASGSAPVAAVATSVIPVPAAASPSGPQPPVAAAPPPPPTPALPHRPTQQSLFSPAGAPLAGTFVTPGHAGAPQPIVAGVPFLTSPSGPPSYPPAPEENYVPVAPPPMSGADHPRQFELDYTMRPRVALARKCRSGHVNPAYLDACQTCGGALGGAPYELPQPSLGRLVISTGGEIPLDQDSILGRNPKLPANLPGEPPQLVKIADSTNDVSNRHLLVRVAQWQVIVRDLGSTNGTDIVRPGWPPVPLPRDEEAVIEPGTQVILGGAVTLTYEGTA